MIIHTYNLFCEDENSKIGEWNGKVTKPIDMIVKVWGVDKESIISQWKELGFDRLFKAKSIQGFGEVIYLEEGDQFHITKGVIYG